MSLTARASFIGCCIASVSIIGFVHYQQSTDRAKLKEGVYRDIERQAVKQQLTINTYNLNQQKEMEKILRKEQAIQDEALQN
ncbi:unnamed protein product [Chironomus riparius]|uniref:Uncharacterized protein n=1 Tax=Chironomus riparius TaxID=315576 RepID=A0A9N9WVP7_9DIPT|nr:unnamed protein product [Chironomus riparius]